MAMVVAFVAAGLWLQGMEGYRISSAVQTAALPDPLSKTVVREPGAWMANYAAWPLWALPALGVAGALAAAALLAARRTLTCLCGLVAGSGGVIGTAGASMFPLVMPSSTHLASSLTVWDSVSSHKTLGIMFWATLIFMPLIVTYTSWAYRVMRGKVTEAYIRENDHAAY